MSAPRIVRVRSEAFVYLVAEAVLAGVKLPKDMCPPQRPSLRVWLADAWRHRPIIVSFARYDERRQSGYEAAMRDRAALDTLADATLAAPATVATTTSRITSTGRQLSAVTS